MKILLVCASFFAVFAAQAQNLELKRVSLSSSGVGYFEYETQVTGKAKLSLSVALDKVDDVLKSLVIYDTQGSIGGVSLVGLDPISQTLKQLPFDATALNKPAALLEALRGTEISVAGKSPMRGRIVSVVKIAATSQEPIKHQVMLMTAQGMQQFVLETAENLQFEDLALREQINKALTALSNNRAKDARNIDIISEGTGTRTVRVGYVTTVPIWKNAYRFTLPNAAHKHDTKAYIQGWAVIENMSGQDWTNVQLTLTAGKPVAFSQQLYKSYYNNRPQVSIELPGNIVPTTDNGTYKPAGEDNKKAKTVANHTLASPAVAAAPAPVTAMKMLHKKNDEAAAYSADSPALNSAIAFAQATDVTAVQDDSTQVSYTFGLPVTVGSGRSLSIPIIQNELPMTRVALYQPNVNRQFPLAAIELSNTSPNGMPAGAVTLYEANNSGNQFVGDAQLNVLPASDKRYVAYALDQKISIAQRNENSDTLKSYSVKGAFLNTELAYVQDSIFTIKSAHTEPHDVVIELPIQGDGWELVANPNHSAIGKTANQYRRKIIANPLETRVVSIRQQRTAVNTQHLSSFDAAALRNILNNKQLDNAASPVLTALLLRLNQRDLFISQRTGLNEQLKAVRENQSRIRDNLKSIPVNSAPHNRYMAELNKADALDSQYSAELAVLVTKQQAAETALRDYLAGLK